MCFKYIVFPLADSTDITPIDPYYRSSMVIEPVVAPMSRTYICTDPGKVNYKEPIEITIDVLPVPGKLIHRNKKMTSESSFRFTG